MDELLHLLKQQSSGIRTFSAYLQRALALGQIDEANAAQYALLGALAGRFVSSYDGAPLAAGVAARAHAQLVLHTEDARKSIAGSASEKLALLNTIAAAEL